MSEKHFHGQSHGRLHVDEEIPKPKLYLTTEERCIVCGATIENAHYYRTKVHTECWPVLDKFNQIMDDCKQDEEIARDAEWLAPVMTFENGEAQEVRPYHSNNGTDQIPF